MSLLRTQSRDWIPSPRMTSKASVSPLSQVEVGLTPLKVCPSLICRRMTRERQGSLQAWLWPSWPRSDLSLRLCMWLTPSGTGTHPPQPHKPGNWAFGLDHDHPYLIATNFSAPLLLTGHALATLVPSSFSNTQSSCQPQGLCSAHSLSQNALSLSLLRFQLTCYLPQALPKAALHSGIPIM